MTQIQDIEKALTNVYIKIFREIKKSENYPTNLIGLQTEFNKLVYDNTRSAVQQSVIAGGDKVNNKLKTESFISQTDLDIIKKQTDIQVASFWRKMQLDMNRELENRTLLKTDQESKGKLDTNALLNAVATSAAFSSLANATLSKVNELAPDKKVKWVTRHDEKVCPICSPLDGQEWAADDTGIPIPGGEGDTHFFCRCVIEPI